MNLKFGMRNSEFGIMLRFCVKNNFNRRIFYNLTQFISKKTDLFSKDSLKIGLFVYCYTKHHLKFGKNQADNLVAVENRFILDFGADFFLYFIGV